jgi:hypothetical protein
MTQSERNERLAKAVEDGMDSVVEFYIPEPPASYCFFTLDGDSDLTVVYEDRVAGEMNYLVNLDAVVSGLLQTLTRESGQTADEKPDDISTLKSLARRFQSIAARLSQEASRREGERWGATTVSRLM